MWIKIVLAPQCIPALEWETHLLAVADTGLYEVAPTNNLGTVTEVPAGVHSNNKRSRYLVRFQPETALPASARIRSAELLFHVTTANAGEVDYGLHRLLRTWTEGTKGGVNGEPATAAETTWLAQRHPEALWTSPGGEAGVDYEPGPSVTATFTGSHTNIVLSSRALTADVQLWLLNPGTNFGWMLRASNEAVAQSVRRIASREASTNAPSLRLRYRLENQLTVAVASGAVTLAFWAEPNRFYAVESRTSLAAGPWTLRTNFPPIAEPGILRFTELLDAAASFYRLQVQ